MTSPLLKLYVLGSLDSSPPLSLTTFAEYKSWRGLSRINLVPDEFQKLEKNIRDLRGRIEGGFPNVDKRILEEIGAVLFKILITGNTNKLFLIATGESKGAKHASLPLEIITEDYRIAGWPWEYLYNTEDNRFLAQDFHPVSRNIFSLTSKHPIRAKRGQIHILLILGVSPEDKYTTPKEEVQAIRNVFETYLGKVNVNLRIITPSSAQEFNSTLTDKQIDVLHYFGHAGFDYQEGQGYLAIDRGSEERYRIYARALGYNVAQSRIRLVFLNACRTAEGSPSENPGRSSVAATLLDSGIPAVIGAQFLLPDVNAHFLASTIYKQLLLGNPIGEAVRFGRNVLYEEGKERFFDWGVPVLYTTDPGRVIFPPAGEELLRASSPAEEILGEPIRALASLANQKSAGAPSIIVERTRLENNKAQTTVALLDIDAKVGFLPEVARQINKEQDYFNFEVLYVPVPTGYVRYDFDEKIPQTFLPRLRDYLLDLRRVLGFDYLCAITENPVAFENENGLFKDHFSSNYNADRHVIVVSTYDLRRYAQQANTSFAKAVLLNCLAELVASDERWALKFHSETVGCPFDKCDNRDDIVVSFRHMRFDHKSCRDKIKDTKQLQAIDAMLRLKITE